jgi:hypothetical protein
MRRSWTTRLLAAFLAAWLPLCLADAGVVHVCAMHQVGAVAMPGMDMTHTGQHADRGPAGGQHGAPSHQQCTCLGPCTAASGLAPAAEVRLPEATLVAPIMPPLPAANDDPWTSAQVRLPFAMGPPASSLTL